MTSTSRPRSRWRIAALAAALTCSLATTAPAPALATDRATVLPAVSAPATASVTASAAAAEARGAARPGAPRFTDGRGLEVLEVTRATAREWRLRLASTELEREVRVRILLPRGYATSGRRYPVLHLHHGTGGSSGDWIEAGDADRLTRGLPLITVMPDSGYDGNGGSWFTDWVDQGTALGRANWEGFHVRQLVPWIDDQLRTVRGRHGRAIAGLSQGGFGAFSYAARHPDLFSSAASFSGAPDIAWHPLAKTVGPVVVAGILSGLNGVQPYAAFGDPVLDAIIWEGHNPANLVENLRRTDLHLWTADGLPGELDEGPPDVASTGIEGITHLSTGFFAQAADQAGVDYTLTDYGQGTHTFAYWRRDLEEYLVPLMAGFARGPQRTGPVSYRAIEPRWEQWGWRVVNDRTAPAWSALEEAGPRGFVLTGASAAVVRTPRVHVPGRTYRVSSDSPRVSSGPVRANARGRLSIAVEAGSGTDPVRVTIAP